MVSSIIRPFTCSFNNRYRLDSVPGSVLESLETPRSKDPGPALKQLPRWRDTPSLASPTPTPSLSPGPQSSACSARPSSCPAQAATRGAWPPQTRASSSLASLLSDETQFFCFFLLFFFL